MLEAAGAGKWYNIGVSNMCMMGQIRAKLDEIYAIAKEHKAEGFRTSVLVPFCQGEENNAKVDGKR